MKLIDKLLMEARAAELQKNVTLTFEDGTQKRMTAFEAIAAIFEAPRVTATDQPPGSLIWALFGSELEMRADDWPEEALEVDRES